MISRNNLRNRTLFKGFLGDRNAGTEDSVVSDFRFKAEEMLREIACILHITGSVKGSMDDGEAQP